MKKTALVTGASSGIGEAFAVALAEKTDRVVLVARREERLKHVAQKVEARGAEALVIGADLSDEEGVAEVENWIRHHPLDLLVNNAGIGMLGNVADLDARMEQTMIDLNIRAVVRLTRAALPNMLARKEGGIIQVASMLSHFPSPHMAVYAATKAFVLSYAEGLAEEVKGKGVQISVLCPGSTESEFAARAGFRQRFQASADEVAHDAIRQFEKGKTLIIPGMQNRLFWMIPRIVPRSWSRKLMKSLMGSRLKAAGHSNKTKP